MRKILICFSVAALILAGCDERPAPEKLPVQVCIEPVITRVTETDFETGDRIGLTLVLADGSVYADNAVMTFDGRYFTGDLVWYDDETECTLTARYPYTESSDDDASVLAEKHGVRPQSLPLLVEFRHKEPDPVPSDYEEFDGYFIYHGLRYDTFSLPNGQVWMSTPLAYAPDGLEVSDDPASGSVWYPYSTDGKEITVLKDDASVQEKGLLYSYEAIFGTAIDESNYDKFEGARGICPPGWHVPTRPEWYSLCGASNASAYLGESGAQTDPSALFWDQTVGYAPVGAFLDAGFRSLLSGCIANNSYSVLGIDSSVCSVEDYFGQNRMAYIACSSPNRPNQFFALMTTFTSANHLGRVSLAFATLGRTGVQLRCMKD